MDSVNKEIFVVCKHCGWITTLYNYKRDPRTVWQVSFREFSCNNCKVGVFIRVPGRSDLLNEVSEKIATKEELVELLI